MHELCFFQMEQYYYILPPIELVNVLYTYATSKMKLFVEKLIFEHLTIVAKSFILNIARVLDPPLHEPLFCISNIA